MLLKRTLEIVLKAEDRPSILFSLLRTFLSFDKGKLLDFVEDCEASIEVGEIPGLKEAVWKDYRQYVKREKVQ